MNTTHAVAYTANTLNTNFVSFKSLRRVPTDGLSAEEVATFTSARGLETDIAKQTGQNVVGMTASRMVRLGVDTTQNLIWGGLDILGMDDNLVRKGMQLRAGLDAIADKYNKDENTNFFTRSLNSGNIFAYANPVGSLYAAYGAIKDFITVA